MVAILGPRWGEGLAWGFGIGLALGIPAIIPILTGGLTVMFAVEEVLDPPLGVAWIDHWSLILPLGAAVGILVLAGAVIAVRAVVMLRRVHWSTPSAACYAGSVIPALVVLAIIPPW